MRPKVEVVNFKRDNQDVLLTQPSMSLSSAYAENKVSSTGYIGRHT